MEEAEKAIKVLTSRGFLSLTFQAKELSYTIDLESLEFKPRETAKKAFEIGRKKDFKNCLMEKFSALKNGVLLSLEYNLDQKTFDEQINNLSEEVFVPTIEPSISLENQKITINSGRAGQFLDKRKLMFLVDNKIKNFDQEKAILPIIKTSPTPTADQIEKTQKRAEALVSKKLVLEFEELNWELDDKELVQLLSFTNGFDEDKVASISSNFSKTINRFPENAAFEFKNQKVVQFRPAKEGRTLRERETIDTIISALEFLETEEASQIEKVLSVEITQPQITTADVNSFGIKELLAKGESFFRGSISSRIHNLNLASSRLNGIIIPPGEVFSMNKALGDISAATGYQQAYIIENGRTILGDGGGVCQTSTTLFRAALNAGLEIIERRAHAYRVSYYEQGFPPGLDATIFSPTTDLKFKNNTPAHILIQTNVDIPQKHLVYELYGTNDQRVVYLSKPKTWDQVPPPPDLYQDDPTLPVGTIKQVDWKSWGAKVSFDYKVTRNGETLYQKTFYSNYKPWQAIFLRSTASQ